MEGLEEKLRGLSIVRRSRPEDPTYLLDVCQQPGSGALLAVSCSDFTIRLHDKESLRPAGRLRGHRGPLCGITFAHASPALLYSGSGDGTVRLWDIRQPDAAAAQSFKSDVSYVLCSLDVSCSDALLCAGTEQLDPGDSLLLFWDPRAAGGAPLGVYSESHSDDITQVRFHPRDSERLASGSTDGLVNVFDLSRGAEEEALLATCNSASSASWVSWAGPDYDQLLCLSHDEGLHLWDLGRLTTDQPLAVFSTADARSLADAKGEGEGECGLEYLVGGCWLEGAGTLLVVGGARSGDIHLMECSSSGLRPLRKLRGGHTSTVRCFLWDEAADALLTGGEDAQLLLWKPGGGEEPAVAEGRRESAKSQSVLRLKSRPHKKHQYQREKKKKDT